jgi:hypothetical protein
LVRGAPEDGVDIHDERLAAMIPSVASSVSNAQ